MTRLRTEVLQFTVTAEERKLIEKCSKREDKTVSEYVRGCVLMEMVLDGEVGAMKIVAESIGRQAVQALRKRADRLAALGNDPVSLEGSH